MNWEERQEYYDLIEEEIQFKPAKGRKWILTFEERHTFGSDVIFHVYSEKGTYWLQVHEVVNVMELEVEERLHKISDTISGNFRIRMSTLKRELPGELKTEAHEQDGSRFKLTLLAKEIATFEWEYPLVGFDRIQPVLKLIWAVDGWQNGAKAMGWSTVKPSRETSGAGAVGGPSGAKKEVDPFGKEVIRRSLGGGGRKSGASGGGKWSAGKQKSPGKPPEKPRKKEDQKGGKGKGRIDPFGTKWEWDG